MRIFPLFVVLTAAMTALSTFACMQDIPKGALYLRVTTVSSIGGMYAKATSEDGKKHYHLILSADTKKKIVEGSSQYIVGNVQPTPDAADGPDTHASGATIYMTVKDIIQVTDELSTRCGTK